MRGATIITWGNSVRGREAKALEVFGAALTYFDGLAKSGRIENYRVYASTTGNVSKWGGMLIVEGQIEELQKIRLEEEYRTLIFKAGAIVENLTIELAAGGSPDDLPMTVATNALTELGYL